MTRENDGVTVPSINVGLNCADSILRPGHTSFLRTQVGTLSPIVEGLGILLVLAVTL